MLRTPGRLRRLAQVSLLALALPLLATGCGQSDPPAGVGSSGGAPTPSASSAGFTGKWSKLAATCPALTGAAATSLRKTGPGTPSAADADTPLAQNVNCTWGEGTGSVGVSLYLNRSDGPLPADQATAQEFQQGFDKYVQDGSTLHWKPEPGLEEKAYLGIHKDRVTIELFVLSSNARFTVFYQVKELDEAAWDAALAQHRDTMRGLAADVLDDLG
ncbi:hypothetical protein [Plantactinospora soyae]|uniref:DUF3558 domain-containing protein n=1 Tax=Plantactinospora soyae TaxID=1544732 RepID=A0A927R103_9ACTN|nr:hypothetical protein [Plantactinospora soyae]MBE1492165.1 hypothetical protein [Plantactinospora soyae]